MSDPSTLALPGEGHMGMATLFLAVAPLDSTAVALGATARSPEPRQDNCELERAIEGIAPSPYIRARSAAPTRARLSV